MPAYEYVIGIRAVYHFLFMENPAFLRRSSCEDSQLFPAVGIHIVPLPPKYFYPFCRYPEVHFLQTVSQDSACLKNLGIL
jgi:hypothetical protein